jgi:pseudouridine synthase
MIRLAKFIAQAGVASRRGAEALIKGGEVRVNGKVVREPGTLVDPEEDRVQVENRELSRPFSPIYILMNKPRGVVTTLKDPQGRTTVRDLLKGIHRRVFPVGRLDYHTEGVLLLTNDGELAQRLLHPRYQVERTYQAKVKGVPSKVALERMREGIEVAPGVVFKARVRLHRVLKANSWLEFTLREGRYREVRRMCEAVGNPVLSLKRTRFGPLSIKGLPPGAYRQLTQAELEVLYRTVRRAGQQPGIDGREGSGDPHGPAKKRRARTSGRGQRAGRRAKPQRPS